MAEGHAIQAQAQLVAVIPALRRAGPQTVGDLAQALQSLGEAQLSAGQARQAVVPLQEAVALLGQSRGPTWELAVARERLAEALAAGDGAGAHDLLVQAIAGLEAQLGATHPETLRAQRALTR
jgi:hypothetical protein